MSDLKVWQTGLSAGRKAGCALAAGFALFALVPASSQAPNPNIPSYFEFGTVVALGQRNVDIQLYDERRQRNVQHSFVLSKDSRADVVHVGDTVEVIYTPGVDWTVRRLVLLTAGIPKPGTPADAGRDVPAPTTARLPQPASGARVPAAVNAGVGGGGAVSAKVPNPTSAAIKGGSTAAKETAAARNVAIPTPIVAGKAPAAASSVELGIVAKPKVTTVIDVPLGAGEAAMPKTPVARTVAHEMPAEECNRSSADWPRQPLRLAVLDFRYPTEREESHDVGTTGGGSGTAVADLVYARLDQLNEFAMSRGDRTRLYRGDFAGAARVGRELGVDAVLAGTFQPVDPPPGSDPDFPPPKTYELRAGIVDTCTGQLLMRLTSVSCPDGLDPNSSINAASCKRFSVTAKQAMDPKDSAASFRGPLDAMLFPLEHNGPPPGSQGSAGVVASAEGGEVTIKLPAGSQVKVGDQIGLHAYRLTKNPTTYTLHNLHDEEIGRVTVKSVRGGIAVGSFIGDFPPHPGDTAELITE
jgi:hypothetical protein